LHDHGDSIHDGQQVEALGMSLPGNAASLLWVAPAGVRSRRRRVAIVEMVREDLRMPIFDPRRIENAIFNNAAIGGSSNAVIHLLALARRVGVPLSPDDWDRLCSSLPRLVDLQPSGQHLMEDFSMRRSTGCFGN
jgi:dihydroxy-acid dehydratase